MSTVYPLRYGLNAKSNDNRNVQKYINLSYTRLGGADRVAEDGIWGRGTDVKLWKLAQNAKNGIFPLEAAAPASPILTVPLEWYNGMLAEMRKAGWQPYGDAPAQSTGSQAAPEIAPETSVKSGNNFGKIMLGSVLLTAGYAWYRGEKTGEMGKYALRVAPITLGGGLALAGLDAARNFKGRKEKHAELLRNAIAAEIAKGQGPTRGETEYITWANQIEASAKKASDASPVVRSVIYQLKRPADWYALQLAYGLRRTAGFGLFTNPAAYLESSLFGPLNLSQQSLPELLSGLTAEDKKEINRHLAQFLSGAVIAGAK